MEYRSGVGEELLEIFIASFRRFFLHRIQVEVVVNKPVQPVHVNPDIVQLFWLFRQTKNTTHWPKSGHLQQIN